MFISSRVAEEGTLLCDLPLYYTTINSKLKKYIIYIKKKKKGYSLYNNEEDLHPVGTPLPKGISTSSMNLDIFGSGCVFPIPFTLCFPGGSFVINSALNSSCL